MRKPTDYPVGTERTESTTDNSNTDITYADLKARVEAKQLVTDEMIRTARAKLDAAHNVPIDSEQGKFNLDRIRDKFQSE